MLVIGLTGNIGAGKSTVSSIFSLLGVPVYQSDEVAKELMTTCPLLVNHLRQILGAKAYTNEGKLDKPYISQIIFNDKNKREQVEKVVHPRVNEEARRWALTKQSAPYVIRETALLFETVLYRQVHRIIGVLAPCQLRLKRIVEDFGKTPKQVLAIMRQQIPTEKVKHLCHYLIENDENRLIIPTVIEIHEKLLQLAEDPFQLIP